MIVCRVIGQAVATVKTESLRAVSLMIVRPADTAGADAGEPFVFISSEHGIYLYGQDWAAILAP